MHITSDSKQAENTYCSPSSPSIPQFQPWRSSNPRTCRRRWPLHLGLPSRWRPTGDLWQPMLKCCAYIAVWSCLTQGCFPDLAVVRYRKSPTLGFWSQRNVSWDSMWVKCDIHIHSQHMWAVPQMGVPQNKLVMSYNGKFRGTPILGNPWKPPYQTEVTRITSCFFGKLWKKNLPDWSSYLQWILVTETPEPRMSFPMIFVCYVSIFAHIWAAEKTSKKT